ncbi:hypothetical protein ACFQX6_64075 [Streptosporangium lutulentum]
MNLKDSATRVAVLRVLRDTVNAAYEAERRTVLDGLRAARAEFDLKSIRVTLPDHTPVATITLVDPQSAVVVADEDAFTAWVAANHPGEVETLVRVRPGWQRAFLTHLAALDPVADPHTGEVIPGLTAVAPSRRGRSASGRCPAGRRRSPGPGTAAARPAPAARPRRRRDVMTAVTVHPGRATPATAWSLASRTGRDTPARRPDRGEVPVGTPGGDHDERLAPATRRPGFRLPVERKQTPEQTWVRNHPSHERKSHGR